MVLYKSSLQFLSKFTINYQTNPQNESHSTHLFDQPLIKYFNIILSYLIISPICQHYKITKKIILNLSPSLMYTLTKIMSCKLFISLFIVSFFLPLYSSISLQPTINQTQHKYQQILTLNQNSILQLQFTLNNDLLPFPLRNLTRHYNTQISIHYGPYHHKIHNIHNTLLASNSITTTLKGLTHIPKQLLQTISSTFLISLSQRYHCYYQQINSIIFNDPNQKFCIHHLQQIIRNILPCHQHSGLMQLLNIQQFFIGNKLYGINVLWNQEFVRVLIEFQVKNKVDEIKKIKINNKCLQKSLLIMSDAKLNPISIRQTVINRLLQSLSPQLPKPQPQLLSSQPKLSVIKTIQGNWYHKNKKIIQIISCQLFSNNSQLIIRQKLPKRAGIQSITIANQINNQLSVPFQHSCIEIDNQREIKYKQLSVLCQLKLKLINKFQNQPHLYKIQIRLQNKLIGFENYEHIFGGGTEIPQFPIVIIHHNQPSYSNQPTLYFLPNYLSLKTPEPDESLPFQIITFILAVFGYLWIAIWRKFTNDIVEKKKKDDQE